MSEAIKICGIRHPEYLSCAIERLRNRFTLESGDLFILEYLEKYSSLEEQADFEARRRISFCPSHAKAALLDIKNAIFSRMVDITRLGGPPTYVDACKGENSGVDFHYNSMNAFIGDKVLLEMLGMRKVGVFIDKFAQDAGASLLDTKKNRPYLRTIVDEDICSWSKDQNEQLNSVLIRLCEDSLDLNTGLTYDSEEYYLLFQRIGPKSVQVRKLDKEDADIVPPVFLELSKIPVVIFEINQSLLKDIAKYQIALLNMNSADLSYCLKSNIPFYTEQFRPTAMDWVQGAEKDATTGEPTGQKVGSDPKIKVGTTTGRRYPAGLERPQFIAPPGEPLRVSMEKETELKLEIRQLINLAVTNIKVQKQSAESQQEQGKSLENGLSNIGLALVAGEREIAEVWSEYEGHKDEVVINYPTNYALKSDDERLDQATKSYEFANKIPSKTFQKLIAKSVASSVLGPKLSQKQIDQINQEIDEAIVLVSDPDIISTDLESGLVSTATASKIRGYPEGEVEQAKKDHADRASRIALAQSKVNQQGVADLNMPKEMPGNVEPQK